MRNRFAHIIIRCGFAPDLPAILECLNSGFAEPCTVYQAAHYFREMLLTGRIYVATIEGIVVGVATLNIERKLIHKGGLVCRIEDVAVLPDYRNKGVGSALVKWLVDMAKSTGAYKVILDCGDEMVSFYEKIGFRRASTGMRIDLQESPKKIEN